MGEARKVDIVVISAEKLRFHDGGFFKHTTFVIVRTDSRNFGRTALDSHGGSFPTWNESLGLTLAPTARSLQVEVYCKTVFGNKMVGEAEIPLSDFAGDLTPARYLHFLSYRLRDKEGGKNGIINLSIRMDGREPICGPDLNKISDGKTGSGGVLVPETVRSRSLCQIPAELVGSSSPGRNGSRVRVAVGIPVSLGFPV